MSGTDGNKNAKAMETRIVHNGRNPRAFHGFVNPPVYRGSTVLFPTLEALETRQQRYLYGRRGTPTTEALEQVLTDLEGGARTVLTSSGLAAVVGALTAFVSAGDHILVADTVYQPTRHYCDSVLARLGVVTEYFDPMDVEAFAAALRSNTRLVYLEAPGSQTFEVPDLPALVAATRSGPNGQDRWILFDNTWATPVFFRPLDLGMDVSVHAATKYVVGHADAMLGALTMNERAASAVVNFVQTAGGCAGSEEVYLGHRGIRTMHVRLAHHQASALAVAEWLAARPEVKTVLHPAMESCPGHANWRRDFSGSSGLFSILINRVSKPALAAFLDDLRLFGMGYSWGGFESLVVPFDVRHCRTARPWTDDGIGLRLHIGLESVTDLIADLEAGFDRMNSASQSSA